MPDYAVIALGGKQYRVREGEQLVVDRLRTTRARASSRACSPPATREGIADGGSVTATVEEHLLGKKILVFTYKPKRNSRKTPRAPLASVAGAHRVHHRLSPQESRDGTQEGWRLQPQRS